MPVDSSGAERRALSVHRQRTRSPVPDSAISLDEEKRERKREKQRLARKKKRDEKRQDSQGQGSGSFDPERIFEFEGQFYMWNSEVLAKWGLIDNFGRWLSHST